MKQNTGTNMSRPQIWDEAFELIERFNVNISEPEEQVDENVSEPVEQVDVSISQPEEQVDENVSEPVEQVDVSISQPEEQVDVNVSEPVEQVDVSISEYEQQVDVNVSEPAEQVDVSISQPEQQVDVNVSEPAEQVDVSISQPEQQVDVNVSEPAEQVDVSISQSEQQVDVNVSEPVEQVDVSISQSEQQIDVNVSVPEEKSEVNISEPGEHEIAFREITEEISPETQVDDPVNLRKSEVSLKNTDVPEILNEKEVSLRKGEANDLITIDLETMDFDGGKSKKSARELYYETQKNLLKSFHLIKDEKDFSIDTVFTYAGDMAAHIKEKANAWMQLLYKIEKDTAPDAVMHIVKHSLDTAIIAIRIGIGLKLRDETLDLLAMQSCLHDAGMLKLPPELILKQGKLPRKEIELIRKHPEYGHVILSKYEGKFKGIAEIAYQVHERYDGSGYPRGKQGKDIPEHSLIIGIADMFAALLHPRPYRPRRLPFEAIKEILAVAKEQFPKDIIRALVNEFSAFPEGLFVKLNSNEIGKVITVNRLAPLSPVVEILYNGQGKLKDTKIVDLMKDHCLYIASGFYGEEE